MGYGIVCPCPWKAKHQIGITCQSNLLSLQRLEIARCSEAPPKLQVYNPPCPFHCRNVAITAITSDKQGVVRTSFVSGMQCNGRIAFAIPFIKGAHKYHIAFKDNVKGET